MRTEGQVGRSVQEVRLFDPLCVALPESVKVGHDLPVSEDVVSRVRVDGGQTVGDDNVTFTSLLCPPLRETRCRAVDHSGY